MACGEVVKAKLRNFTLKRSGTRKFIHLVYVFCLGKGEEEMTRSTLMRRHTETIEAETPRRFGLEFQGFIVSTSFRCSTLLLSFFDFEERLETPGRSPQIRRNVESTNFINLTRQSLERSRAPYELPRPTDYDVARRPS